MAVKPNKKLSLMKTQKVKKDSPTDICSVENTRKQNS